MPRRTDEEIKKIKKEIVELILSQRKRFSAHDIIKLYYLKKGIESPSKELPKAEMDKIDKQIRRCVADLLASKEIKYLGEERGNAPVPKKLYRVIKKERRQI